MAISASCAAATLPTCALTRALPIQSNVMVYVWHGFFRSDDCKMSHHRGRTTFPQASLCAHLFLSGSWISLPFLPLQTWSWSQPSKVFVRIFGICESVLMLHREVKNQETVALTLPHPGVRGKTSFLFLLWRALAGKPLSQKAW